MATAKHNTTNRRPEDFLGQRFGRWVVIGLSGRINADGYRAYLECHCDCGTTREVQRCALLAGTSQSCGCLHRERVSGQKKPRYMVRCRECDRPFPTYPSNESKYCGKACASKHTGKKTHGLSRTRIHAIWCGMKSRCKASSNVAAYYADRGITVCREWTESFDEFRDWSLANGYVEDKELDRIDCDKGYSPENCRWATRVEQMRNTRKRRDAETSRFKGVSWCANAGKWRAQIYYDGTPNHIGLFEDELDAAIAYDTEAKRVFKQFANLNFKE